jgi:hypothetical protein
VFLLRAAADLDFTEAQRVVRTRRQRPASRVVVPQRFRHTGGLRQFFGNDNAVLESETRARGQVRRGGMHRVTDHQHATAVPGLGQQHAFQRPVDHVASVVQPRAYLLQHRRGDCQQIFNIDTNRSSGSHTFSCVLR